MYLQESLAQQRYEERLHEAQRYRVVSQVRALSREQRRLVRGQRLMSMARVGYAPPLAVLLSRVLH